MFISILHDLKTLLVHNKPLRAIFTHILKSNPAGVTPNSLVNANHTKECVAPELHSAKAAFPNIRIVHITAKGKAFASCLVTANTLVQAY